MKKVKFVIFSLFSLLFVVAANILTVTGDTCVFAQTNSQESNELIWGYLEEFLEVDKTDNEKTRVGRIPGSDEEYQSAMYIKDKMDDLYNFVAVNNASTVDGVESFEFVSEINGNKKLSQNIIYRREAELETDKKIIICAHYDTACIATNQNDGSITYIKTDGLNDNAASVATLLAIAKSIDDLTYDQGFDIEIVFFGASTNGHAGSNFYLRGLNDEDMSNIMLVINLDNIAVGCYNYFYVNEFRTPQEDYFKTILSDNFKLLNTINVAKQESENNPTGLQYTHVGLESDNVVFMSKNINTINIFSGDYESFRFGKTEFDMVSNITYTENDSYSYIMLRYGNIAQNLYNVYKGVLDIVEDKDLVCAMQEDNALASKYGFWTNEKLAGFITTAVFLICVAVVFIIYYKLKRDSKKMMTDVGLEQLVIKIAQNIGEDDNIKEFIDQKVKGDTDSDDSEDKNK